MIRIKPHHFVDILRDLGAGKPFLSPPEYRHAVPQTAQALQDDPDVLLELTAGVDDICAPCAHNRNGTCDDVITRYDPPIAKDVYNRRLDERWFERLGLHEGSRLAAREFCELLRRRMGDLRTLYLERSETDTLERQRNVEKGIETFLSLERQQREP